MPKLDVPHRMLRHELEDLHAKYSEILTMRLECAAGAEEAIEPRRRMAALAARFPGALREIDDLELVEIQRRVLALHAVLHADAEPQPWMEAISLFHSLARGALCAKRWLAGRKQVDGVVTEAYVKAIPVMRFPSDAERWTRHLAGVARPPRGRLVDLIFTRIADRLQTTEQEARRLVFGTPRAERRRQGLPR